MEEQSPIEMMNDGDTKNWTKLGMSFYETKNALVPVVERIRQGKTLNRKLVAENDIYYLLKCVTKEKAHKPNFRKAAKQLLLDRNEYVHDLDKAKVTDKKLAKWKKDMLHFLEIMHNQHLTEKAETAKERIEKIFDLEYIIVSEDKYVARMSDFEGRLLKLEIQIDEERHKVLQIHQNELKSIKDLLAAPYDQRLAGVIIKEKFDKAEKDLMKVMKDHGDKISMLESQVYEINDRQGNLHNAIGYLLMREPDIQQRQTSADYVNKLKNKDDWDPVSKDAEVELMSAANQDRLILVDLLITENVPVRMEYVPHIKSAKGLRNIIQHLQKNGIWNPESSFATEALEYALAYYRPELQYILVSNGVNVTAGECE